MILRIFSVLLLFLSIAVNADENFPGGHVLMQNEAGDYLVKNADGVDIIEPAILKIGNQGRWILACIDNESWGSDTKRMVFVDLRSGGLTDTINTENWTYFKEVYPELGKIELRSLSDAPCP